MTKSISVAGRQHRPAGCRLFIMRFLRGAFLLLALAAGAGALAQKDSRITLAIHEGAAAEADYAETKFRFEDFAALLEKTLDARVTVVVARNRDRLKESLKARNYQLLLARPNDLPAEAVRDFGYQLIATAREPSQAWFVVMRDSPLRSLADLKGRTIVTSEPQSNTWRVAHAMLRDHKIGVRRENVKSMRDQAAIGWAVQGAIFEVGVIDSVSAVARSWENNGGRVIARSRDLPNMPFIASPDLSGAQVARLRAALIALDSSDPGRALLKKTGLGAFQETPARALLDFLAWIGDPEAP